MPIGSLLVIVFWIIALPAQAQYREIEVSDPGRIEGVVKVTGELPKLPPQPVFKQKEYCGAEVADERLVASPSGELQNAVVYLTDIKAGRPARLDQPVKLDNHKCGFVPHVLTATLGQTLEIHNSDPFLHDAHALLGSRTLFNVAILSGKTMRQPLIDAGLIHINCNVRHTWMHAYMLVADHPYHAVTDAEGHFALDGVPPGIWTLRVWHELLGSVDEQVRLQPGETVKRTISLEAGSKDVPASPQ